MRNARVPANERAVGRRHRQGLCCAGVIVLVLGLGFPVSGEVVDRLLASVDRQVITLSDVRVATDLQLVDGSGEAAVLDRLVNRALILGEVGRYAPAEPPASAVDARLEQVRERVGAAQFATALRRSGLDEAGLRLWLRQDLLIERYLAQRFALSVAPTDDEVEQYYAGGGRQFVGADGSPLSREQALVLARERLTAERRERAITEWLDDLRRRAVVDLRPVP